MKNHSAMKERERSESGSTESEDKEPIAPDGGWGWVILVASFFSSVIVDGVCFSFGIFYLEFLEHFGANKGKTAWIGSVLNGMYMIMGPVAGALSNRYGCRVVAILGSIWSALAFFLSTFTTSIDGLIVSYGVFGGMGFGLMYLPSIVMVGHYFDKRRALATGIATCGSGIGAFIFAPMCQKLIETYAWKGALWIVAGVVLNGVILSTAYRPLTEQDMKRYIEAWRKSKIRDASSNCSSSIQPSSIPVCQLQTLEMPETKLEAKNPLMQNTCRSCENLSMKKRENLIDSKCIYNSQPNLHSATLDQLKKERNPNILDSWHGLSAYASVESIHKTRATKSEMQVVSDTPSKSKTEKKSCLDPLYSLLSEISASMDLAVLKNPVFAIYAVSCILCMKGFFVPFIYLVDRAVELGYSESKAALLLSILGITNTVGRVVTGWASDRPWADCLVINNFALIIGGIATIAAPHLNDYILLALYASIFGLCIAAFVSLRPIILVDLIGLKKLTSSLGIIVLCQGITSFVGAPIAGSLYDVTGSYNVSFYVAGVSIALAGIICLPLRRLAAWQDAKSCRKSDGDAEAREATPLSDKHFQDELSN